MEPDHQHVWTDSWIRGHERFRACKCGVYDNPNVLASDFPENPFEGLTGND